MRSNTFFHFFILFTSVHYYWFHRVPRDVQWSEHPHRWGSRVVPPLGVPLGVHWGSWGAHHRQILPFRSLKWTNIIVFLLNRFEEIVSSFFWFHRVVVSRGVELKTQSVKWSEAVKKRREEKLVIVSNFISVIPKKSHFLSAFWNQKIFILFSLAFILKFVKRKL